VNVLDNIGTEEEQLRRAAAREQLFTAGAIMVKLVKSSKQEKMIGFDG